MYPEETKVPLDLPEDGLEVAAAARERVTIEVPVPVLSMAEQLVHDDPSAAPVYVEACYDDPAWQKRPFDEGYDPGDARYSAYGIDAERASAIYAQPVISPRINSPDRYVWESISGAKLADLVVDCIDLATPDGLPLPVFALADMDAVSVLEAENVFEVMLRPNPNAGLKGIAWRAYESEDWFVLFTDESGVPIRRCSQYGCE
jgi:hypothetical protein